MDQCDTEFCDIIEVDNCTGEEVSCQTVAVCTMEDNSHVCRIHAEKIKDQEGLTIFEGILEL